MCVLLVATIIIIEPIRMIRISVQHTVRQNETTRKFTSDLHREKYETVRF